MTAIHQSAISSHHSGHKNEGGAGHGRQTADNHTGVSLSSTVNISSQAALRLQAYQAQKTDIKAVSEHLEVVTEKLPDSGVSSETPDRNELSADARADRAENAMNSQKGPVFSKGIDSMLSEVQDNIVQSNEPGYQHLVNLLNNHGSTIDDQQQLQEIMRREQFFLNRRKPFMDNSEFQSYSQVLSQFSNIVQRQQYSF